MIAKMHFFLPFRWMKQRSVAPKTSQTSAGVAICGAQGEFKSPVHWWHVRRSTGKRFKNNIDYNLWNKQKFYYVKELPDYCIHYRRLRLLGMACIVDQHHNLVLCRDRDNHVLCVLELWYKIMYMNIWLLNINFYNKEVICK